MNKKKPTGEYNTIAQQLHDLRKSRILNRVERLKGLTANLKRITEENNDCERVLQSTIEFNDRIINPEKWK
jgi:hypothetical protein